MNEATRKDLKDKLISKVTSKIGDAYDLHFENTPAPAEFWNDIAKEESKFHQELAEASTKLIMQRASLRFVETFKKLAAAYSARATGSGGQEGGGNPRAASKSKAVENSQRLSGDIKLW